MSRPMTADDLRGENAIGVTDPGTPPVDDQRSPDAREPVGGQGVAQPVVVEVTDPPGSGFDWTAAIIGMAGGLALAVLAGVGVAGSRRRRRPSDRTLYFGRAPGPEGSSDIFVTTRTRASGD